MRRALLIGLLLGALITNVAHAQGTGVQFLNFEAPAHKPIAVVDVAGTDYLLVANGADNSVEVYDTVQHNFLLRVPVGQRPVTIAVRPTPTDAGGREIYVANWLSDSITVFALETASPGPLRFDLIRTALVGDEPVGIVFLPENPSNPDTQPGGVLHELVLVTFSAQAGWGSFFPGTLASVIPHIELLDLAASPVTSVRDPRAIHFAPPPRGGNPYDDQMWILNFRGGNDPEYDFDLWGTDDLVNAAVTQSANLPTHGGFGTTNFNMAFAPNGELWVVGVRARNKDLPSFPDSLGEPIHLAQTVSETGFAVSFLARHKNPASAAVSAEVLDLNDSSQGRANPPIQAARPVTQPTDVVVYGDGDNPDIVSETEELPDNEPDVRPAPTRIFVTGMSSDTLAAVEPTSAGPSTWRVYRVDVSDPVNAFTLANTGGLMRGPRGLALKASGAANDPRDRLYVYNRLTNSVTIVDPNFTQPNLAVLGHFQLAGQIEPAHVIAGRKFMYSSKLSAGGNVSCATCHIDGNTDFIAWNLSDGGAVPDPANPGGATPLPGALGPNPGIKGPMVTQPLRGLVNFEVANDVNQDVFYSNRPYHWRGDKGFLEQFNAAFVNLMGLPDVSTNPPNPGFHMGIQASDMILYRDFVFSMHYPPNPHQPGDRTSTGTMFDEDNPPQNPTQEALQINTRAIGSGGQLGLKLFHILNTDGVACNICHSLPEGSNNLLTDAFFHSESPILETQNLETAQLKGLVLKERRLRRWDGTAFQTIPAGNPAVSHEFGLIHTGENTAATSQGGPPLAAPVADSINDFVSFFGVLTQAEQDAVSLYMREFDSGVAPLAGISASASVAEFTANPTSITAAVQAFEQQAERANIGAAVHVRVNGVLHGLWYDVTQRLYVEETQTGVPPIGPLTQSQLLAQIDASLGANATNLLIYHATPLGSPRRVARIQGGLAAPLSGSAPQNIALNPSPTMTANVHVPQMVLEWTDRIIDNATGNAKLDFFGPGSLNSASLALFELSLVNHAPGGFGVTQLRHEAPRRFQVEGDGIRDGAFLRIFPPTTADILSALGPGQPPTNIPNTTSHPFNFLLPIYPARNAADEVVWETAVEMAPDLLLFFMNGGVASTWAVTAITNPNNPGFRTGLNWTLQTTDLMLPNVTNFHYVQVENVTSGGVQVSPGSWQRITVTP